MYEINAQLKVNGTEVPIQSFQYQVPTGKLGSILHVDLAKADPTQIPNGAAIEFNLLFNTGVGPIAVYTLLSNGKLQDRDYTISYQSSNAGGIPRNKASFDALDVISDKFNLAPRRPVTMYDPYRVKYDQVYKRSDQQLRTETYGRIEPIIEPVAGLTMRAILNRAYTGSGGFGFITPAPPGTTYPPTWLGGPTTDQLGCGFDAVITNIQDFNVRRADFTIEGGWHDGAGPSVAMYDPVYCVLSNKLFILYMDRALPSGITAYTVPIWKHKSLTEKLAFRPDANAVIVTYQYNGNDPTEDQGPLRTHRDLFHDDDVDESEVMEGEPGYYKVTVRRWDREIYMSDQPSVVLDTLPLSSDTETVATITWYNADGDPTLYTTAVVHKETIEYTYENDLKVGHNRETQAAVMNAQSFELEDLLVVEKEVCRQSWVEDPLNPGVKLLDRVIIDLSGICYYDPDTTETLADGPATEIVRYLPALLAQRSQVITDSWILTDLVPIKTIRKKLQNMKGGQLDMEVLEVDHLANTLYRSHTEPVTGSSNNDQFETKSRQVLLVDETSVTDIGFRVPVQLNTYELPRVPSLALGHQKLIRLGHPLMLMPIDFVGVDLAVIQGSVIRGEKPDGSFTSNYFVTGFTYTGSNLGKEGHRISQTCEAIELLALS